MSGVLPRDPAVPGRRVLAAGPLAAAVRPRTLAVPALAAVALLAAAVLSIGRGSTTLPVTDVVDALLGGGDRRTRGIVTGLRLPRTLTGVLVGAALGLSGAVFQTLVRNPLASPDVLGITWGSAVGAVGVIVLGGQAGAVSGVLAGVGVPAAALAGGLGTGVALFLLARRRGLDGYRTVLVGIGLTAVGSNLVYWLLTVGEVDIATRATTWLVGSLGEADRSRLLPVAVALAVLVPLTLAASRTIAALQFGEDTALALGVRADAARAVLLLLATALAAAAVSAAGPVGFVALAAPQIALRAAGSPRPPLVSSAVFGALLVTVADLAVRVVPVFDGLPVGVLTAVLGAPYLAFLFLRSRREVRP